MEQMILDNPILKTIAMKHRKSVPQVCLRWALDIGCSTLPKSSNAGRQKENFNVFDFSLTDVEHAMISEIPHKKIFDPAQTGPYKVFTLLWDDEDKEIEG